MLHRRAIPLAVTLAALAACQGRRDDTGKQGVQVTVEPGSARVQPGGSVQLAAVVTGTADAAVVWDVVETGGGTVDNTGLYTAPASAGTFHVRATSRASPSASGTATVEVAPPAAPVGVSVSPRAPSVLAGGTVQFSAVVSNAANTGVTWSVPAPGCGTVTQGGLYTAPATAGTCSVVATSQEDPSRSDTATVTVTAAPPPVVVTITPSPATVDACQALTFSATVTGTTNTAVAWSVQEGSAGGTIDAAGVYVAPANAGTYHVVATSAAAPESAAVAPVAVTDRVLSVAVSPATVQVPPGGTTQFTATVTTTCGTFASTAVVNSAGEVVAN